MRIFLIGYMGSGKSTLGKALAKNLNYKFIDLDHHIEERYGKTISQIFETEGEQRFREIERDYLHGTTAMENTVISSGGGTPCFYDNIDWMNEKGMTVYLEMAVDGLFNRLVNAKDERPLLQKLTAEEMKAFIRENLSKREPYYLKAQHVIKGQNVKPRQVISLLHLD